jgi:transposase
MTKSKRRSFTAEFKAQVVLEVISGVKTFSEACREYQLSEQTLSRWKQEFVQHAAMVFERPGQNDQEQQRVAELERVIGKLTIELEIAKKASSLLSSLQSRSESWR